MRNHDQLVADLLRRPGVRNEVERLEREALQQLVADSPTTSASDWDDALTSRSTAELRAQMSKRRERGFGSNPNEDEAQLAALVHARIARGNFVAVDPKDL